MDLPERIQSLISHHFPWGEGDKPADPGTGPDQLRVVEAWLEKQTLIHGAIALALIARLTPLLDEVGDAAKQRDGERLFYRLDTVHLVKNPASILERMVREVEPPKAPCISFDSLRDLKDLGRFRIVVNFLSDARLLRDRIARAWAPRTGERTPAECALFREFELKGSFEDLIDQAPKDRTKGERCYKGLFHPKREHRDCTIEIQIQTQLQEAWDKKDHCLIYEPRRRGECPRPEHEREIYAMSELLYLADLTFDRIRQGVLESRGTGDNHATQK